MYCGEEPGSERHEDRAEDHKRCVVPEGGDEGAADDDGEDDADEEGDDLGARFFGAGVLDGLEPEGELRRD